MIRSVSFASDSSSKRPMSSLPAPAPTPAPPRSQSQNSQCSSFPFTHGFTHQWTGFSPQWKTDALEQVRTPNVARRQPDPGPTQQQRFPQVGVQTFLGRTNMPEQYCFHSPGPKYVALGDNQCRYSRWDALSAFSSTHPPTATMGRSDDIRFPRIGVRHAKGFEKVNYREEGDMKYNIPGPNMWNAPLAPPKRSSSVWR